MREAEEEAAGQYEPESAGFWEELVPLERIYPERNRGDSETGLQYGSEGSGSF